MAQSGRRVGRFQLQTLAAACLAACALPARAQSAAPDISQLPAVTVQGVSYGAGATQLPSTVSVLNQQQLTEGQQQVNMSEVLNQVPGLVVNNRQDYAQDMQLSIRGWGADSAFGVQDVIITMDGMPLTMPDGQGQIQLVNLPTIGNINVIKGPFAALYGNAAGGVIQTYTRAPADPPTLSLSSWAGAWNTHQTTLVGSDDHGSWGGVAGVSDFSTDGWRQHSAATRHQFNGVLSIDPDPDNHYSVVLNAFEQQAQDPGGLSSAALAQDPRQVTASVLSNNTRKSTQHEQSGVSWEHRFSADDTLRLSFDAGNRNIVQYLSSASVTALDDNFGNASVQYVHGGDWRGHRYDWEAGVDDGRLSEYRKGYTNVAGNIGSLTRDQYNTVSNLAEHVQGQFELTPRLSLAGGVRHDLVGFNFSNASDVSSPGNIGGVQYGSTDPVAGLLYKLDPVTQVYLDYGHGFVTPTSYQVAYVASGASSVANGPNLGLQPMHLKNTELGLRTQRDGVKFDAAVYAVSADNQIVVLRSVGGNTAYVNTGPTYRYGTELSAQAQLPWSLSARLAYDLSSIHVTGGQYDGSTMPGAPRQQLVAALTWRPRLQPAALQGFYTTLEAQARSQVYVDVANSASAGGWAALNWVSGVEQHWGAWKLSEFVRVDNLADRNYVSAVVIGDTNHNYYEAAPGRNLSAGASLTRSF